MRGPLWGKLVGHDRRGRERLVLFFDTDNRGAHILPAARRASISVKNYTECTSVQDLDHARAPRDH
eukprot:8205649-Pyramimonas_sp.AAC.1